MKTNYSISIPKPCHEDWSKMTPNEKGRFCQSCSKTVVDFTKMKVNEVQDYIHSNRNQRICGHIKQSQLNAINLKIPETVFNQTWNFHRLFLMALLLAMGTTLLNCSDDEGRKQKISNVEVVQSHEKIIDTISKRCTVNEVKSDSTEIKETKKSKTKITEQHLIEGMMIIETVGDIEVQPIDIDEIELIDIGSLEIETPVHYPEPPDDEIVFGLITEHPPEFEDTPVNSSLYEKKDYLSKKVSEIVNKNFNTKIAEDFGLKGKQRIRTQFKIDKNGFLKDIKVRASHKSLEDEAIRVIKLIPQFKPARQRGKNIGAVYSLPIVFIIED